MLSFVPVAGIDVGKHLLVGVHPAGKPLRCDNTPAGIERLIDARRQRGVLRVAPEAIGPYAHPVTTALAQTGFSVAWVDPRRVRAFRTAEGRSPRPIGWRPTGWRPTGWTPRPGPIRSVSRRSRPAGARSPN